MTSIGDILAMIVDDKSSSSDFSGSSNWSSDSYDSSKYHNYSHGCSSCGYCRSCYDKYGCNRDSFEMWDEIINQNNWEMPKEYETQDTENENYWNSFFSEPIQCIRNFYLKRNAKKTKNGKINLKKQNTRRKNNLKNSKIQILKRKGEKRREKVKKVDYLNGWF